MTAIIAKKNQAKLAEHIYRGTHCKYEPKLIALSTYTSLYSVFLSLTVTRQEVENLLSIFREECVNKEKLDRTKFRDILHNTFHMTDDILMDRGKRSCRRTRSEISD